MKKTTERIKEVIEKGFKGADTKQLKLYTGKLKLEGEKRGYQLRTINDPQITMYGVIQTNK